MHVGTAEKQIFAPWYGQPLFHGAPLNGRHVYIVRNEETGFFHAYGTLDGTHSLFFKLQGHETRLEDFVAEARAERAQVTYGLPPFDTNTGGDKPASDTTRVGRQPSR